MSDMNAMEMNHFINTLLDDGFDPETGELLDEDRLFELAEQYEADKLKKCEWMLKHINEEKYKVEAMTSQKRNLEQMIKTKQNVIERMSKYVAFVLEYQKWETPDGLAKISYRQNKDVVKVDDINKIPIEFFKQNRYESNLDKSAIKKWLKSDVEIDGVHLEDTTSVIIKG